MFVRGSFNGGTSPFAKFLLCLTKRAEFLRALKDLGSCDKLDLQQLEYDNVAILFFVCTHTAVQQIYEKPFSTVFHFQTYLNMVSVALIVPQVYTLGYI